MYWPARINEIRLPTKAGTPGKYNVTFCDGVVKNVMAEWMVREDQDAFITCRVRLPTLFNLLYGLLTHDSSAWFACGRRGGSC